MKVNKLLAGAALALVVASPAALAGALTGNVGAVSNYMFRGVPQAGQSAAAVQGGVDWAAGGGLYLGAWSSNATTGTELDLYGGYTFALGDLGLDLGAIYYFYPETDESGTDADEDFYEGYLGLSFGPVSAKGYFTPDYYGPTDEAAMYITVSAALSFSDTLTLTPQIGLSSGDGVEDTFGDSYADYSLTLTKALKDDMSASFAVVGSDLDEDSGLYGDGDAPKVVVGFKKTFSI